MEMTELATELFGRSVENSKNLAYNVIYVSLIFGLYLIKNQYHALPKSWGKIFQWGFCIPSPYVSSKGKKMSNLTVTTTLNGLYQ